MKKSLLSLCLILAAISMLAEGCSSVKKSGSLFTPADDIISYEPIDINKSVITVGTYVFANTDPLEKALEAKFPDIDFVFTKPCAGNNDVAVMKLLGENGKLDDLNIGGHGINFENDFLYDLSGEAATGRYSISALDSLSVNGKLYNLPLSSSLQGIAYNKTLFEEHGWKVPSTLDEFYKLCDQIMAAGIRPFVPCFKYQTIIESVAYGFSYEDIFLSADKRAKYNKFLNREESCKGLLEPAFEVIKNLYDKGYITADDFHSSATEERHNLYDGKNAMIPSNINVYMNIKDDNPAAEIDFMGFPTSKPDERMMQMQPGYMLSVSKVSMSNTKKADMIRKILDYLSTDEGQKVILDCFAGVSSLTGYQNYSQLYYQEAIDCMDKGRVFFTNFYTGNEFNSAYESYTTGAMSLDNFVAANDASKPIDFISVLNNTPIGKASDDFTMLDTSIYNADVMREATGADIGLILHNYFFTGNLARIFKGDIVLPERFILKSVGGKSYLTVYEITGANLKALLEHPFIGGKEINAMYAVSGLKMEYAPWADPDENVRSLTLTDGTAIDDNASYKVAAWPEAIDPKYITSTVQEYADLGANMDIVVAAIQKAGTISPAKDGRIKLNWTLTAQK